MRDAPKQIWAWPWAGDTSRGQWTVNKSVGFDEETLYTRADLHTAAIAERDALRAKVERLRKAAARAIDHLDEGMGLEARRCLRIALGDNKP